MYVDEVTPQQHSLVYLEHGGGKYFTQNDVTVTPCLLTSLSLYRIVIQCHYSAGLRSENEMQTVRL